MRLSWNEIRARAAAFAKEWSDATGVFEPRDIFLEYIETRTGEDGAQLTELFQVLNTPEAKRLATRDEDLAQFPYINGDLFDGPLRVSPLSTQGCAGGCWTR